MIGIGTDIVKISRIERILADTMALDSFLNATYTKKELNLIKESHKPLCRYSTHFAGKEAVFKCLGISSDFHFKWNQIEILYHETCQPYVVLHGDLKEISKEKGFSKIMLSLSYEDEYAVAFAIGL